jgi:hypothetical protein
MLSTRRRVLLDFLVFTSREPSESLCAPRHLQQMIQKTTWTGWEARSLSLPQLSPSLDQQLDCSPLVASHIDAASLFN